MLDTGGIESIITDLQHVCTLSGNSGKKVRIAMERLFQGSSLKAYISLQGSDRSQSLPLARAYAISVAKDAAALATQTIKDVVGRRDVHLTIEITKTASVFFVVEVNELPESMRDRQALLEAVEYGLSAFVGSCKRASSQETDVLVLETLLQRTVSLEDVKQLTMAFDELAGGKFEAIDRTPMVLVELASYLNPVLAEKLKSGY